MGSTRDDAASGGQPSESAYEGRTDNPASDTEAAKNAPAVGSDAEQPSGGASNDETRRDDDGAAKARQ
jgi:hypothetical protein